MNKMYFIAHVLPSDINKQILKFKQKMQDRFGCTTGLKSPAHITVIPPFWMDEDLETSLIADIDILASSIQSFRISTQNFNCFRPRTIFIEPVLTPALQVLKKDADAFLLTHKRYPAKPDTRPFHPHITIATRDLQKKDFYEAWPLFENKNFEVEWKAKSISLLRHDRIKWEVVHTSIFKE